MKISAMITSSIRDLRQLAFTTVPLYGGAVKGSPAHLAEAVFDSVRCQAADHQSPFKFVEDVG